MIGRSWVIGRTLFWIFVILVAAGSPQNVFGEEIQNKSTSFDSRAQIVLGNPVQGITLAGPLAGKQVYLLPNDINLPGCWMDSVHWTGTELFYAVTSLDFSKLISGTSYEYNSSCHLPEGQTDGDFDIYAAKLIKGKRWDIRRQLMNSDEADAGISVSNATMAYTIYRSPPQSWDIYLVDRISPVRTADRNTVPSSGTWSAPRSFPHNSSCREDNPALYAGGTKIIFESNRIDASGSSCYDPAAGDVMRLWYSEKAADGSWSVPELLAGAPNEGTKNTQPWVDEKNNYLYWTADTACACIRRIPFDGKSVSGAFENVVTPSVASLHDGTADGKVVFTGEYSEAGDYAFLACATAHQGGPFLGKWSLSINLCVVPLGSSTAEEQKVRSPSRTLRPWPNEETGRKDRRV